ncbi:hypothetical protein [Aeromicrobium sp. UC242_57]|uniref:hypothetical protein n=1 Tax=Aeromicrobium sp. UC242_57 TaxID=3374624 RepID=UPI00379D0A6A
MHSRWSTSLAVANLDAAVAFGGGQLDAAVKASLAIARACVDDLDGAYAELQQAGRLAVSTQDMPILAEVVSAGRSSRTVPVTPTGRHVCSARPMSSVAAPT